MSALPPYALTPPTFRFRALVALAERLPLGGDRELVLATFVTARVLWDWSVLSESTDASQARSAGTRHWVQSLTLPPQSRIVFQQLIDAMTRSDRPGVIAAWERTLSLAARAMNGAARPDLKALAGRLATGSAT
ncbi:MAG: hypothetical protein H7066_15170 [Cytophagaceae bacterium]|nr:hypothetical protein [Gemmatimonadaceae bacterium]